MAAHKDKEWINGYEEGIDQAIAAVCIASSADSSVNLGNWIPFKERKPEKPGLYITLLDSLTIIARFDGRKFRTHSGVILFLMCGRMILNRVDQLKLMINAQKEVTQMTFEEAKDVFLHHLDKIKFACDSETTSDAEKWAEAVGIISEYLSRNPSEDCVSRQAVGDLISSYIVEIISEGGRDLNAHTNKVLRQILSNICSVNALPPVSPQIKKGHWIDITSKKGAVIALRCSCCKESPKHAIRSRFCPNCGAEMTD